VHGQPAPPWQVADGADQAEQHREQAAKDEQKAADKTSTDAWMVRLTGGLLVVGAAQALIFAVQAFVAYTQLRAYLFIEEAKIEPAGTGRKFKTEYRIKNNGVTPAHKVKVVDVLYVDDEKPAKLRKLEDKDSLGSIGPQGDYVDMEDEIDIEMTKTAFAMPTTKKAIFLRGRVTYRDVFFIPHKTEFCFFADRFLGKGGRMEAFDRGNDSN
jgi:hypothetical protein